MLKSSLNLVWSEYIVSPNNEVKLLVCRRHLRKYGTMVPKTSNNNVTKKTLANSIGHNKCQEFSLVYPRDF